MTSLLVFEPQEFYRTPSNVISIFGADDKAKTGCGQDVAISATGSQYIRRVVVEGKAPSTSYHDFNTEHLIPSVTHHIKITSDARDYIYSGSKEGGGCVYVSVQDATLDRSTSIKHATKLFHVMKTSIGTNE